MKLRLSDVEILMLTKHLAVMVKAGIPITESLSNLAVGSVGNPQKVIKSVLAKVEQGSSLADSIHQSSPSFSPVYVSLIKIGEESGNLDTTLAFLATQLAKVYNLKRKIRGAMLYPSLVMGLMFAVGMSLALFVLPKLTDFFTSFDTQLPLSTQILLWVANLMKNYGLVIVAGLVFGTISLSLILNSKRVKPSWHKFQFRFPYIGKLVQASKIAETMRNLGILLGSGVPILSAWETITNVTDNEYLRFDLNTIREKIKKGSMIGESMQEQKVKSVPYLAQRMLSIGERTGKTDEMASYVADYYEEELDSASKNLTVILEPILLIIVGLMVAFLALAIISPIYQITGSIGG